LPSRPAAFIATIVALNRTGFKLSAVNREPTFDTGRPKGILVLTSLAAQLEAKVLAEKRHHMILETIGHLTCVRARIDFEADWAENST
jgi:hypothetical protein